MGWTWEVQLWCIKDLIGLDAGIEAWGWETIYRGESFFQVIKITRSKKKETGNAVRIIWR